MMSFLFTPNVSQAYDCSWWSNLWNNCDREAKDFTCYKTQRLAVQVEVEIDGIMVSELQYQEVSVASGNRIDCVVGGDTCREEPSC